MPKQIRKRLTGLIGGVPMANEIVEVTPPEVTAIMSSNDGQFVKSEDIVGYEPLKWTIKFQGEKAIVMAALGQKLSRDAMISISEKGVNQNGIPYFKELYMGGPISSIKEEAMKMGEKPTCTIEGTAKTFKEIENGFLNYDIDTRTGKTVIAGVDQADVL